MKVILYSRNEFKTVGDDYSTLELMLNLETIKTGLNNIPKWPLKKGPAVAILVKGYTPEIQTGGVTKREVLLCLDLIISKLCYELKQEAKHIVGNNDKRMEKYIDLMILQGAAKGNKNN